jgi:hypothetical protein
VAGVGHGVGVGPADCVYCKNCRVNGLELVIPKTVREGVLVFVRSTFGTTTLIRGPFEIGVSHVQDQTAVKAPRTCGGRSRDCQGSGRVESNGIYMSSVLQSGLGDRVMNPPTYEVSATCRKCHNFEVDAIKTDACEADCGFRSIG